MLCTGRRAYERMSSIVWLYGAGSITSLASLSLLLGGLSGPCSRSSRSVELQDINSNAISVSKSPLR
jgi:hypothetical protein